MRSSKNVSLMYDDLVTPSFTDLLNNVGNDIKSIKYPPIFLCLLKFISDNGSQRKNTILFFTPSLHSLSFLVPPRSRKIVGETKTQLEFFTTVSSRNLEKRKRKGEEGIIRDRQIFARAKSMAHFTNCSRPIKVSTQFSSPLFHHRDFGPKSFCGFPRVRSPLFCYQFLPSFETGTLEASIKPRLFKREKLAGNLFKSAAINYRHVRGLSRLPRCSYSYTDVFIIAAVAPALFSFPIRGGGFRDFGYQVVVEMAFAITASALVSPANVLMVG